jgi:hypothetical protein
MSGFLTGVVSIVDSDGNRVDTPNADGDHAPVELQLGEGLTAEKTTNGSLTRVTVNAEGGELDGDVEGDLDENRVVQISGDEDDNEVQVEAVAFVWDASASDGEPTIQVSGGEEEGGALEITHQEERTMLFHRAGTEIGNAEAINRILGGLRCTTQAITSDVVLDADDSTAMILIVDATTEKDIGLPDPSTGRTFLAYIVGSSTVTFERSGSEEINGFESNYIVPQPDSLVIITSEAGNWFARCYAEGAGDGGGSEQPMIEFSAVDTLLVDNNAPQAPSGAAQTDGCMFFIRPGVNLDITGIRFYWHGAAATTVKCVLWSVAGAVLATVNVVTAGAGIYTGTFASPVTCDPVGAGAGAFNRRYVCSVRDIGGGTPVYTKYDKTSAPSNCWPAFPFFGGRRIGWINFALWIAGDAVPTSTAATEVYPVEPVLSE